MGVLQTVQTVAGFNKLFKTVIVKGLFAQLLAFSRTLVSHTGDTAEFVHATINIPANTLTVNGRIKITMIWRYTGTAGVKTTRVRLTNLAGTSLVAVANAAGSLSAIINWQQWNTGALNTNVCVDGGNTGYGASGADVVFANVDTSQAWTLVITNQNASAADTAILLGYDVELYDVSV